MDVIDLNTTDETAIADELAALDVSGQEIFECRGIQEVDDTVLDEVAGKQSTGLESVTDDQTPSVGQTREKIEGSGRTGLERYIVVSNMPQGRAVVPESVEERLERIGRELQELSSLEYGELGPRNGEELERTRNLHLKLSQISTDRLRELQRALFEDHEGVSKPVDVTLPRIRFDAADMQKLLVLESKISRLESLVGPVESLGKPLTAQLDELKSRYAILGSDYELLEKFQKRLHEIEQEYENSLLGRKSATTPSLHQDTKTKMFSYESRINDLHRFNNRLQVYGPILPQLTDRVRQLCGIDDKLSQCINVVNSIDNCIDELQEMAKKWEQTNNKLERKLSAQEIELINNRQGLNERLADLEAKLKLPGDV
ncbi:hypothetical protein HG537_0A00520 [Torulaspora globosa]|uniref:Uncharacterized protein n=1 Tax=Torulaspora globosa TaxID=48254 RepID=A0A7H9HN72_9SACH|nr:hypothetical protein HG537_0A00520 [Torulaspora sp. CBS 2947]